MTIKIEKLRPLLQAVKELLANAKAADTDINPNCYDIFIVGEGYLDNLEKALKEVEDGDL